MNLLNWKVTKCHQNMEYQIWVCVHQHALNFVNEIQYGLQYFEFFGAIIFLW